MQHGMEDERIGELLMQRATGASSAEEADALSRLRPALPPGEVARWERAAAELTAAFAADDPQPPQAMTTALSESIIATGERLVRAQQRQSTPVTAAVVPIVPARSNLMAWSGWMAAAGLALWFAVPRNSTTTAPSPEPARTVGMLRDSVLTADPASTRLAWTATADSSAVGASGDVVWSGRAQRGVMRIAGLQPNDRRRWQYQLWIFDESRDQKYPVDGGVFDVPAGQSEVLVPIDARVPVSNAVTFAVTVEPAGGVVVSTRERIALLAQSKS